MLGIDRSIYLLEEEKEYHRSWGGVFFFFLISIKKATHQQNDPEVIIVGDDRGQITPQTNIHRLLPSSHADCLAARNQESWLICVRELDKGRRTAYLLRQDTYALNMVFCESLGLFLPQSILKAPASSPLRDFHGRPVWLQRGFGHTEIVFCYKLELLPSLIWDLKLMVASSHQEELW